MRHLFVALIVLPFLLCGPAHSQTRTIPDNYDLYTYWNVSGTQFTVAWNKSSGNVTEYKWEAIQPEKNFAVIIRGTVPQRDDPSFTANLNRAGHYIIRVKACNDEECSEWSETVDPNVQPLVNGEVRPWMIYLYLGAPSF